MEVGSRVRTPNGHYGTVRHVFEVYPFCKDVSVEIDGRRERELWAREVLVRVTEPGCRAGASLEPGLDRGEASA